MNNNLYGIGALLNSPNELIKLTKTISESGITQFDVHSPYPVHGIDKAMKLKSSKLGYVSLFAGSFGALFAISVILYITLVDYPMIIGGKPFFAWPAFVPVIFEVTVLTTAILTVVFMLFIIFKFPNNSHPLHDTNYLKNISSDKFGIFIKSTDENFDENKITSIFNRFKILSIEKVEIELDKNVVSLFDKKFILLLISIFVITSITTFLILNKLLYIQPFNWMSEQIKLTPQEKSSFFQDGNSMRNYSKYSISRGKDFNRNKLNDTTNNSLSINPIAINNKNIELGKNKYLIYCSPCHGNFGKGDSRLAGQFPNPPTLHSEKVRTWDDSKIYSVISFGQNIMPSYNHQLSTDEKWAIVNYVRVLQRAMNAKEEDLK